MTDYTSQKCWSCPATHMVPTWYKPHKHHCDTCRPEVVERFRELDRESEIETEEELEDESC